MKNILLKIIIVVVLFFALGMGLLYLKDNPRKDTRIVEALESNVIPLITAQNIQFFSNKDWCKSINYSGRLVIRVEDSTPPESCGIQVLDEQNREPFTAEDQELFDKVKDALGNSFSQEFVEISPEYPLFYRSEHIGFGNKYIGLGFHVDCLFCSRTRYVYWPNYNSLPPDIGGEIIYKPINKNWYRVDQDWN